MQAETKGQSSEAQAADVVSTRGRGRAMDQHQRQLSKSKRLRRAYRRRKRHGTAVTHGSPELCPAAGGGATARRRGTAHWSCTQMDCASCVAASAVNLGKARDMGMEVTGAEAASVQVKVADGELKLLQRN